MRCCMGLLLGLGSYESIGCVWQAWVASRDTRGSLLVHPRWGRGVAWRLGVFSLPFLFISGAKKEYVRGL